MKIEIRNRYNGNLIFTLASEMIESINLSGANLSLADLRGANLSDADLRGANLSLADLRVANLSLADLSDADLSGADLSGANLPIYSKWHVSYKKCNKISIGCKCKNIEEWDSWFDGKEVFDTERDTIAFKRIYANYRAVREYVLLTKDLIE